MFKKISSLFISLLLVSCVTVGNQNKEPPLVSEQAVCAALNKDTQEKLAKVTAGTGVHIDAKVIYCGLPFQDETGLGLVDISFSTKEAGTFHKVFVVVLGLDEAKTAWNILEGGEIFSHAMPSEQLKEQMKSSRSL